MKWLFSLLLIWPLFCFGQAPPCPGLDPGWSQFFPTGSIQIAGWNATSLALVLTYRQSPPNNRVFQNVPQAIVQRMSTLTDATQFVNQNIIPVYHEALLTPYASGLCPILTQTNSWILTH